MQIFGKIMVCKDLDTAGRVAHQARHLNCVTIKGDQYSKKGTMTGGFIDVTRQVLPELCPCSEIDCLPSRISNVPWL